MNALGWDSLDVLFVTGDAYVDHPSFGSVLLARWLIHHGFRAGIVAQPRWDKPDDLLVMGRPRLFAGISAGALDSLLAHYTAIADAVHIPCILYNVPSRTGCNLTPATLAELAKHPNINAVKEASGNISHVAEIAAACGDSLNIYSGNDDQIVPLLALGGKGVISVLSNVAPQYTHDICAKWFAGETAESLSMQLKAVPLIKALFADVNPIPVKWAMNRLGWNAGDCRLPLVAPSAAVQAQLETAMQEFGLLK